jgi:sulfite reductase (NADPH) hemoprotein beta-component
MDELINHASDEEITLFDKALQDYQNQSMDADRFTAARLQMGIYGQRQEGVNMVRIKLPGGYIRKICATRCCAYYNTSGHTDTLCSAR